MKTFDSPEAAAAPSIAVGVLISLVHLVYIAYFIHQLVPELRIKISELYAPCSPG
jgi:exosortase/archaeosortase